jgi:hypothetical protein
MKISRGMGAINPSKMPGKKVIKRKDNPDDVDMYKKGGKVKKFDDGGSTGLFDKNSNRYNNRPAYGAKSAIGADAAQKSFDKNWMKQEPSKNTVERIIKARDEADNEFKRESNRPTYSDYNKKSGGKVNAAGNYTKPSLRKRIVSQVKAAAVQGTGAGQWSARKAQLVAKRYKAAGGGYK